CQELPANFCNFWKKPSFRQSQSAFPASALWESTTAAAKTLCFRIRKGACRQAACSLIPIVFRSKYRGSAPAVALSLRNFQAGHGPRQFGLGTGELDLALLFA